MGYPMCSKYTLSSTQLFSNKGANEIRVSKIVKDNSDHIRASHLGRSASSSSSLNLYSSAYTVLDKRKFKVRGLHVFVLALKGGWCDVLMEV